MPGVLLEIGYLSNAGDRSRMQEAAYCDEVAEGVAHAVLDAVAALRQEDRNGVLVVPATCPDSRRTPMARRRSDNRAVAGRGRRPA